MSINFDLNLILFQKVPSASFERICCRRNNNKKRSHKRDYYIYQMNSDILKIWICHQEIFQLTSKFIEHTSIICYVFQLYIKAVVEILNNDMDFIFMSKVLSHS